MRIPMESLKVSGVFAAVVIGTAWCSVARPADWSRFRGDNGAGWLDSTAPTEWSAEQNLLWKIALPGPGSSSPIIVGEHVYLTCWSGYGVDRENPGSITDLQRHLLCLDRQTGEELWRKTVKAVQPEEPYRGMFAEHGYASHTPTADAERVYVYFGKSGAMAFTHDGKEIWRRELGKESDPSGWGSASSPILFEDLLIVTASAESEALVGLNKVTGEEVWRQEARGLSGVWGTPVLVPIDADRVDLVLGVPNEIWGFNPRTGKLRWYCDGLEGRSYCSSVVEEGGVVFAIESMGGGSMAVRAGGDGDVSKSHVLWRGRENNRIVTPLVHDGLIYFFSRGVANCLDADTGERVYQARLTGGRATSGAGRDESARGERLEGSNPGPGAGQRGGFGGPPGGGRPGGFGGRGGGQDYGSPILIGDKIYFVTRSGDMFVLRAGRKFEQLAINRVTAETEDFSGTPAVSDGRLYIRSSKHLYCIGQ